MPGFIEPCLPVISRTVPTGAGWAYEIKHDGFRFICRRRQATKPVNTTAPKKPRTADRHREPNRDRHAPGYMRDYMRRRRAAQRAD